MLRISLQNFANDIPRFTFKLTLALHGNDLDALQLQVVVGRELECTVISLQRRIKVFQGAVGPAQHDPTLQIVGFGLKFFCQSLRHFGQIFGVNLVRRFRSHWIQGLWLSHPHVKAHGA